nr:unnamed protein product [Callosobruchus analis]
MSDLAGASFFEDTFVNDEEPFEDSGSEYVPSDASEDKDSDELLTTSDHNVESEGDNFSERNLSPRKRKRGPRNRFSDKSLWKRNIRKRLRNSGKEYTNTRGTLVPEKRFDSSDCECIKGCHSLISCEQRYTLFDKFYALGDHNLQTSYLCGQIKLLKKVRCTNAESKRNYTRVYYLQNEHGVDIPVCKTFFKKTLCVSDGRVTRALKPKQLGHTPNIDRRGRKEPYNKTDPKKVDAVVEFINKIPKYQSHYSRQKNLSKLYLAPTLNMSILYKLYRTEYGSEAVSQFVFQKIFKTKFNLSFHPPVTDSCKLCDSLEQKIKFVQNETTLKELKASKELHLRKAEAARAGMKKDAENGKSTVNDVTVISFDLMSTLPTPHLSTGVCYYKRQLWTYCLGIHNLSTKVAHMYVWNESQGSRGPQEIGTCLLHYTKHFVTTSKLIMYSDQCGGQNRNIKIALLCKYILETGQTTLHQIDHKFLVSGHSYMPCDQDFGVIEKNKRHYDNIYIPDDWTRVIKTARKKNPFKVIQLTEKDFISTDALEKTVTNRKKSNEDGSINWLKIQWLKYKKEDMYEIFYKESNNEEALFRKINIKKRNATLYTGKLQLLYPTGRKIDHLKYSNLKDLLPYIPPIHHAFYLSLQTTSVNPFIQIDENTDILELHCVSNSQDRGPLDNQKENIPENKQ